MIWNSIIWWEIVEHLMEAKAKLEYIYRDTQEILPKKNINICPE